MKKYFILTALLLAMIPGITNAADIQFDHSDWKSILDKAGKEKKFVFLDAYTTWCGPCKWMAANVFTDPAVADFFNKNFVNAKIDMEKGEGIELAKQYGINVYPTLLFVDAQGTLIHSEMGSRDAENFIALGKKVLDPTFVTVAAMGQRFDKGERDRTFLKDYLLRLSAGTPEFEKALVPFKEGMHGANLLDQNSWEVFQKFFFKPDSEFAQYFLSHRKDFEVKYGVETAQQKAYGFYYNMSGMAIYNDDAAALQAAKDAAAKSGLPTADAVVCNMDINWYLQKKDTPNFIEAVNALFKIPGAGSPEAKNNYAFMVYESSDNKKELKTALKWINEALDDKAAEISRYYMLDTKAMLQFKLGKTKAGKATADLAIERAKEEGEDYQVTLDEMAKYVK